MVEMQKGSYIPYFIADLKPQKQGEYIINLEDINKVEDAKKLVTKHVYVDEEILSGLAQRSPLLWIGFKVVDAAKGNIGNVEDVVQTGSQWLAKLTIQNKEVLLPLIEQTIKKVDIKTRTIQMILPEGLLEIYLEP